ncbi:unnamed protein product [Thelazia callipaeda]|uniref:Ion_trans_2 domain-containing protein n=1 Tax=Thelazia callipaeda TaxID=103827 RepID=A0A0N5D1V1_THECL|nr:unnamed protein product [Thelazia callipaeda]
MPVLLQAYSKLVPSSSSHLNHVPENHLNHVPEYASCILPSSSNRFPILSVSSPRSTDGSTENCCHHGSELSYDWISNKKLDAPGTETGVNDFNKLATTTSANTWLKRAKRIYRSLHLNSLLWLAFMMIYMFFGALLFLWLEQASDEARKLQQYKFFTLERELFLKRIDEIYKDEASRQFNRRRKFIEEAIDYLHQRIGVSFSNHSDWSLTTALYYSGTVFTTIGSLLYQMIIIFAKLVLPILMNGGDLQELFFELWVILYH